MSTTAVQLRRIYFVIVLSIFGFLAIQQFLLHFSTSESKEYSAQINRAGKQRMLSQRIAKLCLLYESGDASKEHITSSLREWNDDHQV